MVYCLHTIRLWLLNTQNIQSIMISVYTEVSVQTVNIR